MAAFDFYGERKGSDRVGYGRPGKRPGRLLGIAGLLLVLILAAGLPGIREAGSRALWQAGGWLVEYIWRQCYPAPKISEAAGTESLFWDPDPAYRRYEKVKRFYQEHEYLAWYGNEETGEAAQSQPSPAQEPEVVSAQAVGLAGGSRPVTGSTYVLEQLADYDFLMKHFYSVHTSATADRELMNAGEFLSRDMSLDRKGDGPQILIYHTHSQEDFIDSQPGQTVVGLGEQLARELTLRGYRVYHDTTVYDLVDGELDRSRAYSYAGEGIGRILQENPSIQVVLDIHRDGVSPELHLATEIDGKPTARIMFFNGMSRTPEGPVESLENPFLEDNLAFSLQLELAAQAYFPGFTRKIYLKGLRYNLHLRPRSALVEVGAQTNTYEEALNAMAPLAELLDMVLQQKEKNDILIDSAE